MIQQPKKIDQNRWYHNNKCLYSYHINDSNIFHETKETSHQHWGSDPP